MLTLVVYMLLYGARTGAAREKIQERGAFAVGWLQAAL